MGGTPEVPTDSPFAVRDPYSKASKCSSVTGQVPGREGSVWTPSAVTVCFLHWHAVDTGQKLRWGQSHKDEAETSRAGPRSEELAREGLGAGTPPCGGCSLPS